jgi:hypothetical protein
MKMKREVCGRRWAVIFIIVLSLCPAYGGTYSGGDGEELTPYLIGDVDDWQELMATPADWGSLFSLTSDINLAGITLTPIGGESINFTGVFNGNLHAISNATINLPSSDYVGLFGYVGIGGQIKNLRVVNANIVGWSDVGGLVGYNYGDLTTCGTTGSVAGTMTNSSVGTVGGLVGLNYGNLTSCYSTATVSGKTRIAGLAGTNYGTITACYATGSVSGYRYVAGLVGRAEGGSIICSYAAGSVTATKDSYGGLVGENFGEIHASFWDWDSSGQSGSAGSKGMVTYFMKTMAKFRDAGWGAYVWVMPSSNGVSYPRLAWEGTGYPAIPPAEPIPLTGNGSPGDPYQVWTWSNFLLLSWYTDILDKHIILMSDIDVVGQLLYPIGDLWRFTGVFDGNGHIIHNATVNHPKSDYIGLFNYTDSAFQIKNLTLENAHINGRNYVGGLTGYNNSGAIMDCSITGAVSGAYCVGGFVGYNNQLGSLSSCHTDSTVNGTWSTIGGLVGLNLGPISDSHSTGSVSGTNVNAGGNVGGLVGSNSGSVSTSYATGTVTGIGTVGGLIASNSGPVDLCFASGSVSGNYEAGGLIGVNSDSSGRIRSCFATGTVYGGNISAGGLVGSNSAKIIRCYSTGKPSGLGYIGGLCGQKTTGTNYEDTGNFWDKETSQTTASAMGTGKTTVQMKTRTTFTSSPARWDFMGETTNGTADIWRMCVDGAAYPNLNWRYLQIGDVACPDGVGLDDVQFFAEHWLDPGWCRLADKNHDGRVSLRDFAQLTAGEFPGFIESWLDYGCHELSAMDGDFNGDVVVNLSDYAVLAEHWLTGM